MLTVHTTSDVDHAKDECYSTHDHDLAESCFPECDSAQTNDEGGGNRPPGDVLEHAWRIQVDGLGENVSDGRHALPPVAFPGQEPGRFRQLLRPNF